MDVVNLKISKLGGRTKIKPARDLSVSMAIGMTLEDSWGEDIGEGTSALPPLRILRRIRGTPKGA